MSPVHLRRSARTLTTLATASAFFLAVPAPSAHAAPLPAAYAATAHGDLVHVGASLGVLGSLAQVPLGHAATDVDSGRASADVTAEASNVDVSLLTLPITVDDTTATAEPDQDPAGEDLLAVPLAPIAAAAVVHGDVAAHYAGDDSCPAVAGGDRLLGLAQATTAGVTLVDILGLGSVAHVGAVDSVTRTALVPDASGGDDVTSTVTTTVGDITLLGGLVTIHVSDDVVTTATSDGTTGSADRSNYVVEVKVGSTTVASIPSTDTAPVSIPVDLGIVGTSVDLSVGIGTFDDTSSGATGSATQDAVLSVSLGVTLLAQTLADVDIAVAPADASATAPAGGVECTPAPPTDSDGDGLSDADEATYGTDADDADSDDDGLTDGGEVDTDGAGTADTGYGTDPNDADTDDGGVTDGAEVDNGTDPLDGSDDDPVPPTDTDGDGLSDVDEATHGTDPDDADTDDDGLTDGAEVNTHHTDPLDP
ncbi:hypothetical protein, partial [Nocardioides sp. Root240]